MPLAPFRIERWFARHEFAVEHVLCGSDCESVTLAELLAFDPEAGERLQQLWLGYTESAGAPPLRRAIAAMYETIAPEHVLVHAGAQEAILTFMHAALAPGDHVVVHTPCYQSLAEVARDIGCDVTPWVAREENGWAPDLDELRRLLRPTTRVVVINLPHNPTGYLMPADESRALHALCDERGITLFSDEVYRESEYAAGDRLPAGCDVSPRSVSLGVLSKTYGLPGLRIGWVATRDRRLLARMAELKDYTTICNSAPSELLAEVALQHREALAGRNRAIIATNLLLLDAFFARHAEHFRWVRPSAGPIAFPRLLGEEVDRFCEALVGKESVLLLPGTVYDDRDNHFRIGFGRRSMPDALARLESFLARRRGAR